MARLAHRRLIVLIVLLCQVATAANMPMVHARTVGAPGPGHSHCTEHAQPFGSGGVDQTSTPQTDHARHSGSCDRSCCQCLCAQAPVLARVVEVFSATTSLPVTVPYRALDLPQVATVLFRPPI